MTLLKEKGFITGTNLREENIYFVNEYEDKGELGKKLELDYILDDSLKVAKIVKEAGFKAIVFGDHEEFHRDNPGFMQAKTWKNFRKLLEKIPK